MLLRQEKLSKVKRLSEWEAAAHARHGGWPWGQQIFSEKVMSMTKQNLREWRAELILQNDTVEVVHISDGWELQPEETVVRTAALHIQDE